MLRVWERGVGATLACGSAAFATLVSAARLGLTDRAARVDLPGGELVIEWQEGDDRVLMTTDRWSLRGKSCWDQGCFQLLRTSRIDY